MKNQNKIPEITNDHKVFINIRIDKYLELTGKETFVSEGEANIIIAKIISVWNETVAPDKLSLDNLKQYCGLQRMLIIRLI